MIFFEVFLLAFPLILSVISGCFAFTCAVEDEIGKLYKEKRGYYIMNLLIIAVSATSAISAIAWYGKAYVPMIRGWF